MRALAALGLYTFLHPLRRNGLAFSERKQMNGPLSSETPICKCMLHCVHHVSTQWKRIENVNVIVEDQSTQ